MFGAGGDGMAGVGAGESTLSGVTGGATCSFSSLFAAGGVDGASEGAGEVAATPISMAPPSPPPSPPSRAAGEGGVGVSEGEIVETVMKVGGTGADASV